MSIDWKKQHCGLRRATASQVIELMPDLTPITYKFPENPDDFYWDVKVHMLMPDQYPCIPNWHFDNVPRNENGDQDFSLVDETKSMYLWVSGSPLTEFRWGKKSWLVPPQTWVRFTQNDEHRGTISREFTWRCFIRATHKDLTSKNPGKDHNPLRRHSQVYLNADEFMW